MKNIVKLIGIIAVVAAIGLLFAACSDDPDNGGGGGGDPINGTWVSSESGDKIVLGNGSFTASEYGVDCFKGTYSASGSSISMTVTQFVGDFMIKNGFEGIGLSPTQWYTQQALRTAIINYFLTISGVTQSIAEAAYDEEVAPFISQLFATVIGTVSGNTLTIFGETFTKGGG